MSTRKQGRNRWGTSYDKHFRALNYAPSRSQSVQASLLEAVQQISDVLVPTGLAKPPSKTHVGNTRSAAAGRLRWVLDTCYAQGMLDGLTDGWQLHVFGARLASDLRHRYIVKYLERHPKKEDRTDEKICEHLDAQIDRLADKEDDKKPMPLRKWNNVSWSQALKDKRKTSARNRICDSVMSYLTFCRQLQESKEFALLRAWQELTREVGARAIARKRRVVIKSYAKNRLPG